MRRLGAVAAGVLLTHLYGLTWTTVGRQRWLVPAGPGWCWLVPMTDSVTTHAGVAGSRSRPVADASGAAVPVGGQLTRQVLVTASRRTSPVRLSMTKWPRSVARMWEPSLPVPMACR
jgi:hypothetical protein